MAASRAERIALLPTDVALLHRLDAALMSQLYSSSYGLHSFRIQEVGVDLIRRPHLLHLIHGRPHQLPPIAPLLFNDHAPKHLGLRSLL